jgi:hypothetical protein
MSSQQPIFVISSGRAGSTMVARMVQRHPRLLCVSDLFEPVGQEPYFDRVTQLDGKAFFEILSRPSFPQRIAFWRAQPTDELLYLDEDDRMVSLLTSYTLPFLTGGDPRELYARAKVAVEGFGTASPADHLIGFFDWLRDHFAMDFWVERTGGSLPHTREILATWPDAKVVHVYRDSRETAISMMTGSFFRLYLELEKNPQLGEWDWTYTPPLEEMGAMLNAWVVEALSALEGHPEGLKMDLAYEDLLTRPEEALLGLCAFITERREPSDEDREWAAAQSRRIRPPELKFPQLAVEEQEKLATACGPALAALGYA